MSLRGVLAGLAGVLLCAAAAVAVAAPQAVVSAERARWQAHAAAVTITRDDWGIAHVQGRSDADAVFGAMYAQAEDDFNRIETNYLVALGRLSEVEGEAALWQDLRARLYVDAATLRAQFAASPAWLQQFMVAWADGLNCYLAAHPQVKPRLIRRFEPWMALSFTEGSIGGDIESISLPQLQAFYGDARLAAAASVDRYAEPSGSNGIAIAPANTVDGHALLLINPHTSFFFRAELQMRSAQGLDTYGASTWGQFFIYQGFNDQLGWMHTSSGIDNIDEFAETVVERGGQRYYRYGKQLRRLRESRVVLRYRDRDGRQARRSFTVYRSHHGPVVREQDGKWIAVALMHRPVAALEQSWLRTKARSLKGYLQVLQRRANSTNNTLLASRAGDIAYLHPQFVPRRDDRFDYTKPVDGSDPATDWHGLHALDELPRAINPRSGYAMNTNNWPYSAAGADSPRIQDFPRYMDTFGDTPRGEHAALLLKDRHDFTAPALIAAAYDTFQPAFARLVPTLVAAFDRLPPADARRAQLAEVIGELRGWDFRWSVASVPTSLAVFWAENLRTAVDADPESEGHTVYDRMAAASDAEKLAALQEAVQRLGKDFGAWRTPWGQVNRFQRLTGALQQPFNDDAPSIPVGFTSGAWGSLASFGARRYPGTRRYYGTSGNSFVAVVEFGPTVRAWAVTAGGASGDPASPHFNDQAQRYADGALREVYFTRAQLRDHSRAHYRPVVRAPQQPVP